MPAPDEQPPRHAVHGSRAARGDGSSTREADDVAWA